MHSPFACRFYIGELLKEQPGEVERALDGKLEIVGPRAGSIANAPDTLQKPFPSTGPQFSHLYDVDLISPICLSFKNLAPAFVSAFHISFLFLTPLNFR